MTLPPKLQLMRQENNELGRKLNLSRQGLILFTEYFEIRIKEAYNAGFDDGFDNALAEIDAGDRQYVEEYLRDGGML